MISVACTAIEAETVNGMEYAVIVASVHQKVEAAAEKTWEDFRSMIVGQSNNSQPANEHVVTSAYQLSCPIRIFVEQTGALKCLAHAALVERYSYSTGLEVFRLFVDLPQSELTHLIGSRLFLQSAERVQQPPATAPASETNSQASSSGFSRS